MRIDPDGARVDLCRHCTRLRFWTPHRATKAIGGVIYAVNDLIFASVGDHWEHWSKLFLINDADALLYIREDRRWVKIPRASHRAATSVDNCTCLLGILDELNNPIELHLVVDWTILHILLKTVAHFCCGCLCGKFLHELVMHTLWDISALNGNAHLPCILHCACKDALGGRLHIRTLQHDAGVIAPKLKCQPLQCSRGCCLNCLARACAASEADLGNVWVTRDHCAKSIVAAHQVDDASRERVHKRFREHQGAQWCVWRWLQHDRVASHYGLAKLPSSHERREVPRGDAADDT
mmetsp:Transcript_32283/g.68729  ORF Transcript_32283/g.68729 Transcript_32283/m.68729 type:complete len:294 (-) Transcript_32283:462-1343(-)